MNLVQKYATPLLFVGAAIINIITCLIVWHIVHVSTGDLPIHYNVVSGFDQLGSAASLYGLALFGVIIFIINAMLVRFLGALGRYVKLLCAGSSVFVAVVLLLAIVLLRMQVL